MKGVTFTVRWICNVGMCIQTGSMRIVLHNQLCTQNVSVLLSFILPLVLDIFPVIK